MKRLLYTFVLLFAFTVASAQSVDRYGIPKHSLNFQTGDAVIESLVGVIVGVFVVGVEAAASNGTQSSDLAGWIPFMSASYDYHFENSRWSIGPEVGYWHLGLKQEDGPYQHFNVGTLTVAGKVYYKPAGTCKLYGGGHLGLGVCWTTTTGPVAEPSNGGATLFPAIQINPIGMRLGNEKIAFITEVGVGYRGILQIGASVAL